MSDIIDVISELVDHQLDGYEDRSGYDYNINQDACPRCGRHWHALPLTQRVARMYQAGYYDAEYIVGEDDSPIVCEGAEFIGPLRPPPMSSWAPYIIHDIARIVIVPHAEQFQVQLRELLNNVRPAFESLANRYRALGSEISDALAAGYTAGSFRPPRPCPLERKPPPSITLAEPIELGPQWWHHHLAAAKVITDYSLGYTTPERAADLWNAISFTWNEFTAPDTPSHPGTTSPRSWHH